MKRQEFDRLLSEIRSEESASEESGQAAARVWSRIAGPQNVETIRIRGCTGFRELIAGYLDGTLPEARRFLLEDHLHECARCRRALEPSRAAIPPLELPVHWLPWAMAAMLALGIAIGSYGAWNGLLPGQRLVRATVQSVDGSLYRVTDQGASLLSVGRTISDGDEIRTSRGSRAMVRLNDGSLVEMGERTDLAVYRGWRGTTVRLERGPVIIQAAHQRLGRLYVSTADCQVAVKGTVFAVDHGTKGSRVSVIQGAVQVDQGSQSKTLRPGEQTSTSASLAAVPISQEIAWSKNSVQYLALLGEFSTLRTQMASIPEPGLRYQSTLVKYVPENTVIFASIPNLGNTLAEADRIFEARLHESPVLSGWWNQQKASGRPGLESVLEKIKTLSGYLGDEILVAVPRTGAKQYGAPVILAEVRQSGLRSYLENQNNPDMHFALNIVDNPAFAAPQSRALNVYLKNNLLVASPDIAQLSAVGALFTQEAQTRFIQTPFYSRIAKSYQNGVGWLLAADMEQMLSTSVQNDKAVLQGIRNAEYLVIERRQAGALPETRATLSFTSNRQGIASWLGSPGPMGSLDFLSPGTTVAASFVINNPRNVIQELFNLASASDPNFSARIAEFESKSGVSVLDDIAAPLGGEVTFALDGPLLPVPSWKMICEVDDPARLQSTISTLVRSFNRSAPPEAGTVQLSETQQGGQTFYTLTSSRRPQFEVDYTFVDSYWIAAPNRTLLTAAIQNRETGNTLTRSAAFRGQLPSDGYANFSAIFYHNLASVVTPLADEVKARGLATEDQQKSIDALKANSAPGLIYVYGQPDRIVVASSSGFMGMNLDTLFALNARGPSMLPALITMPLRGPRAAFAQPARGEE
jgi:hypothetical protein